MAVCPVCGFENIYGALACARCFRLLTDIKANTQETTLPSPQAAPESQSTSTTHPPIDLSAYAQDVVVMYFDNVLEPLTVTIPQQAILGRLTTDNIAQPRIDLTPYGAYGKGISRVHALIRRTEQGLVIEDLRSSNGTWLNGRELLPHVQAPIKSGDCLRLGTLSLEILFR